MDVSNIAFGVFDRIKIWKDLKGDVATKYRLLYLECKRNLALIDCFNIEKANQNDPDLLELVQYLRIDIMELVFFENQNEEILITLINAEVIYLAEERQKVKYQFNPLMSVYLKINTIKTLIEINGEGKALRNINYKTRIKNIKIGLLEIEKTLKEHKTLNLLIDKQN